MPHRTVAFSDWVGVIHTFYILYNAIRRSHWYILNAMRCT